MDGSRNQQESFKENIRKKNTYTQNKEKYLKFLGCIMRNEGLENLDPPGYIESKGNRSQ